MVVLLDEGDPDLGTCSSCERTVGKDGRTVGSPGSHGSVSLLTIRLAKRPQAQLPGGE